MNNKIINMWRVYLKFRNKREYNKIPILKREILGGIGGGVQNYIIKLILVVYNFPKINDYTVKELYT